ncbi:MAG: C-GCAxxG-C-C family (seleno)protein [Thermincola sp.]|nr:C-GCAxxG-C-C family (seleno)protein [Thermincola sp.]MDT3702388.1 C-GCAxxG-C-C family (seleno)protein [Thermincola sp.]
MSPSNNYAAKTETMEKIAARAEELYREGLNCCESMLKASIEELRLPLPEDTYRLGRFFREGIAESGCICGALAGGIMILGYQAGDYKRDLPLAERFRAGFVGKFGSTCCRVIRRKQSFIGKLWNRECRELTGFSAGLLYELLNDVGERIE